MERSAIRNSRHKERFPHSAELGCSRVLPISIAQVGNIRLALLHAGYARYAPDCAVRIDVNGSPLANVTCRAQISAPALVKSVEDVGEQSDQECTVSKSRPAATTTTLPFATLAWGMTRATPVFALDTRRTTTPNYFRRKWCCVNCGCRRSMRSQTQPPDVFAPSHIACPDCAKPMQLAAIVPTQSPGVDEITYRCDHCENDRTWVTKPG